MSEIEFKGKEFVRNHHLSVPYRPLELDAKKSLGKARLDGNLIIHGDNLHALKSLLPIYAGKVDCIYIDPPYNTGNEGWCYNDNVNSPQMQEWLGHNSVGIEDSLRHDKWCAMMWPRLQLLHQLLAEDGVIFISIDDNEQHRLRMLMDEIFAAENCITNFVWEKTQHFGRQKLNYYSNCEYIFAYAKKLHHSDEKKKELLIEYKKTAFEDAPLYNASNPENTLEFPPASVQFNIADGIYTKTSNSKYVLIDTVVVKDGKNASSFRLRLRSRWSPEKVVSEVKKGTSYWIKSSDFSPRVIYPDEKSFFESPRQIIFTNKKNDLVACNRYGKAVGTNENASAQLSDIGIDNFDYSKPTSLVEYLISLTKATIVLDSFAGSGTTAHATLSLNKADGGKRKFILVECEDYADNITAERVRRVIKGVKTAKDKSLKDGLGGEFTYCKLGEATDMDKLLSGESLPGFQDLGALLFHTATREAIDSSKIDQKTGYLGTSCDYHIWMIYQPDLAFLKSNGSALTLDKAQAIAKAKRDNKRHLVFASATFVSSKTLNAANNGKGIAVDYQPLPWSLYRVTGS